MDILSLSDGWYNLETSEDGPFFWSSNDFSIYLETPVLELELYLNCNKTKNEYKLKYSTDGWVTENVLDLNSGINVLNVFVDGKKRIDFKCDFFIPSQIISSSDNRKLGIQLIRTLCKTVDNKCYELNLTELKSKYNIELKNKSEEINKEFFKVTLGTGWHDLEEDRFRWTNGNGVLHLKNENINSIKLNISSASNQKINIKTDTNKTLEFNVENGNQHIFINDLVGVKWIEIISERFVFSEKELTSSDRRNLGIQLYSLDVSYKNSDINTFLVKNIFFEKDFIKLVNFLNDYDYENNLFNFNSDGHVRIGNLKNNEDGKFNLNDQTVFYTHRSGWAYAINSIKSLHSDNGIKFEGFLERMFSWEKYKNIKENIIPIKTPWVGVIHNPMLSDNKQDLFSTNKLLNSIVFQKSLEVCKGLYVLSKDLKEKIQNKTGGVPVEVCYLPTKPAQIQFTLESYFNNVDKKIVSLGSWARKFLSIFLLKVPSDLKKTMIEPLNLNSEKFKYLLDIEKSSLNISVDFNSSVEMISYQNSQLYDELLSKNIVFMDFFDISASNLIVECIVRNTPILIKKHGAVIDYLGEDYPFYFESIEEASDKINDKDLIEQTYKHLTTLKTKKLLTGNYFLNSIKNGKIYNSL